MNVIVRSVAVSTTWDDGKLRDQPSFREITFRLADEGGTNSGGLFVPIESTITLPADQAKGFEPGAVFEVALTRIS